MTTVRHFNVREVKARRTADCPECGNFYSFCFNIEKVSGAEYLTWVSCGVCGFEPSGKMSESYADTDDEYVLQGIEHWNLEVSE